MGEYPDYILEYQFPLSTFKKALKEYKMGKILFEEKRYEDAIKKFQKAIEIDSNYVDAYYEWGRSLFVIEDYDGAIEKFRRCTTMVPDYAAAYHDWAHSLESIGDCDEAIEKFKKSFEIDHNNIDAIYSLDCWGELLFNLNRYDEAIEKYRQGIKIDPRYGYAHRRIGDILWYQGKYKDARKEWKKAKNIYDGKIQMTISNEDISFLSDFGELLCCELGKVDDAKDIYKKGLDLDEDNINILIGIVHLYISHEKDDYCGRIKFRKVENILKEDLSKREDSDLYFQLGQLYSEVGEYEDAENNLLKAFDRNKESADICLYLGILYFDNEEFKRSIKYFKLALERDSESLEILQMPILKKNYITTQKQNIKIYYI